MGIGPCEEMSMQIVPAVHNSSTVWFEAGELDVTGICMITKHQFVIHNFRRFATRQFALDGLWGVDGIHVAASLCWRIAALIVFAIDMTTSY